MQDVALAGGQMLGALADDQDQLGFVIERLGHLRADDRLAVRHQRGEPAHEDRREFRNIVALRAFLDVFEIIQPEANDLSRPADRQGVGDPESGFRAAPARAWRCRRVTLVSPLFFASHSPRSLGILAVRGLQVDDLIALDNAEMRASLPFERNDFHVFDSSEFYANTPRAPDYIGPYRGNPPGRNL